MLVRIIKDWKGDIFRQIPGRTRVWDGIAFTEDSIRKCDLLLVLNSTTQNEIVYVATKGKWLFSQEPPVDVYRWHPKIFNYFDRVYTFWEIQSPNIFHSQTALPWLINKSYDDLINMTAATVIQDKQDKVSWVTSDAREKPGHFLRLEFKSFLETSGFKFDIFGRGFTPIEDKFDAIYPYKYSIAIENYSCNDYWTEKISDCFLSWTVPIYYGAKNITQYFPKEAMILIDLNDKKKSLEIINEAMDDNFYQRSIPYIEEARELILNKYQLFPWVVKLINESGIDFNKKKWIFIPKNTGPQHTFLKKFKRFINKKVPIS